MLRREELPIAGIVAESEDTKTFRLKAPESGLPPFQPGQFYALEVPGADGTWIRRSYSVASSPLERRWLDFTIKRVEGGVATTALFERLRPGDRLRATGPFGEFVLDPARPAIFVTGGVGVTPILSMLRYLDATSSPIPVCLLYANRTGADVLFEEELRAMAARRANFEFHFSLTRATDADRTRWRGRTGRFDAATIQQICQGMSDRVAYLCGPISMMEESGKALLSLGVAAKDIRTEAFVGVSPRFGG